MKKLYRISLALLSVSLLISSMEEEHPKKRKISEISVETEQPPISILPDELIQRVSTFLTSEPSAEQAVRNIKSFLLTSKKTAVFLNDAPFAHHIAKLLMKQYNLSIYQAIMALNTPGGWKFLTEYAATIPNNPEKKSKALELIKQIIITFAFDPPYNLDNFTLTKPLTELTPAHIKVLRILLQYAIKPDDVNDIDNQGDSMLTFAIANNNFFLIKLILDYSADPNKTDSQDVLPLNLAISQLQTDICSLLLSSGAHVNKPGKSDPREAKPLPPLFTLITQVETLSTSDQIDAMIQIFRLLLSYSPELSYENQTIEQAIENRYQDIRSTIIEELLNQDIGSNPDDHETIKLEKKVHEKLLEHIKQWRLMQNKAHYKK